MCYLRGARGAVADGFDRGDVEIRNQRVSVAFGIRDEESAAHDDSQVRVTDFIGVAAAEADPKGFEGLSVQELTKFVATHMPILLVNAVDCKSDGIGVSSRDSRK